VGPSINLHNRTFDGVPSQSGTRLRRVGLRLHFRIGECDCPSWRPVRCALSGIGAASPPEMLEKPLPPIVRVSTVDSCKRAHPSFINRLCRRHNSRYVEPPVALLQPWITPLTPSSITSTIPCVSPLHDVPRCQVTHPSNAAPQ